MSEVRHVLYYPSVCLKHILEWVKDHDTIVELKAYRSWKEKSERKVPELPFVIHSKTTDDRLYINFQGFKRKSVSGAKMHYGIFPAKQVLQMIQNVGAIDMVLNQISIMNDDKELYKMFSGTDAKFERFLRQKGNEGIILTFRAVQMRERPEFIMKLVERVMGEEMHNLKFKPSTFDLVGLQTYAQWFARDFRNFLPDDNVNILKKCTDPILDTTNRFIRTYVRRQKGIWVLQESKPL